MRLRKQRKECWIDILKAKYFFGNEILKNLKSPQMTKFLEEIKKEEQEKTADEAK